MSEHKEREFGADTLVRAEADEGVLEACERRIASVDRRSSDKLRALTLVEQDVAILEPVRLLLLGREIHLQQVARVDVVLEHVCDPEIWDEVVALLLAWRPFAPWLGIS